MSEKNILEKFPKKRPPLPDEHIGIAEDYYKKNRDGETSATYFSSRLEGWMHYKVAQDNLDEHAERSTLEIGAGTFNHLSYEQNHENYDAVEPYRAFYHNQPGLDKIRNHYLDVADIPLDVSYDRIISIATFEHIETLPQVVARAVLHMKETGCMRVAIPSEGSIMWYLGWRFTTGLEYYLKYRLNYKYFLQHEHVNTWKDVSALLDCFFEDIQWHSLGLSRGLSFYQVYICKKPNYALAKQILDM